MCVLFAKDYRTTRAKVLQENADDIYTPCSEASNSRHGPTANDWILFIIADFNDFFCFCFCFSFSLVVNTSVDATRTF